MHSPELLAMSNVIYCGPDMSRTGLSSDLCFTQDIPLIKVSNQLKAQVPTHPRSSRINESRYTGFRPFAASQGTWQNLTQFLLWSSWASSLGIKGLKIQLLKVTQIFI